eukprot:5228727-Pyramimonas_sp.AAC.1
MATLWASTRCVVFTILGLRIDYFTWSRRIVNPSSGTHELISCAKILLFVVPCAQIYDEDIDRVNKPFLPVASGELTKTQGTVLVRPPMAYALSLTTIGADRLRSPVPSVIKQALPPRTLSTFNSTQLSKTNVANLNGLQVTVLESHEMYAVPLNRCR